VNESSVNESNVNESSVNESNVNESSVNKSNVNESSVNESSINESSVNESSVNESQPRRLGMSVVDCFLLGWQRGTITAETGTLSVGKLLRSKHLRSQASFGTRWTCHWGQRLMPPGLGGWELVEIEVESREWWVRLCFSLACGSPWLWPWLRRMLQFLRHLGLGPWAVEA